jgi:Mitochondrial carrier protein
LVFLPFSPASPLSRQQTTTGKSSGLAELVAKMYRDQGVSGFYRGVEANVMRACVLNSTKMGCYDLCKGLVVDYSACTMIPAQGRCRPSRRHQSRLSQLLVVFVLLSCAFPQLSLFVRAAGWSRKDVRTSFSSAFVAGFFMTCTVSPFDRIRTSLMNQPTDAKIYNGFTDCLVKTIKNDGPMSLWRGFLPMCVVP